MLAIEVGQRGQECLHEGQKRGRVNRSHSVLFVRAPAVLIHLPLPTRLIVGSGLPDAGFGFSTKAHKGPGLCAQSVRYPPVLDEGSRVQVSRVSGHAHWFV